MEVARMLRGQGEEVAFLGLIDSSVRRQYGPRLVNEGQLIRLFAQDLLGLRIGAPEPEGGDLPEATAGYDLDWLVSHPATRSMFVDERGLQHARALFEVFRANMDALAAYRPQRYPGSAVLIKAEDNVFEDSNPDERLDTSFAADVTILEAPGSHYTMLHHPHVETLANLLNSLISDR
jgi:thioesterase domain-containing protein